MQPNCEQNWIRAWTRSGHVSATHFSVVSLCLWQDGDNCWPRSAELFAWRQIILPHILFPGLFQGRKKNTFHTNKQTDQPTNTRSICLKSELPNMENLPCNNGSKMYWIFKYSGGSVVGFSEVAKHPVMLYIVHLYHRQCPMYLIAPVS